jgi:hypothetical protein
MDAHSGNIATTARALGMHRRTLQRKLTKRPVKQCRSCAVAASPPSPSLCRATTKD